MLPSSVYHDNGRRFNELIHSRATIIRAIIIKVMMKNHKSNNTDINKKI